MPRPKRPGWSRITITVSEEVSGEVRVKSAERYQEMGTFVDQTIRDHRHIPEALERSFASEVVQLIHDHWERKVQLNRGNPLQVAADMGMDVEDPEFRDGWIPFERLSGLIATWSEQGRIPQPYKQAFYRTFAKNGWVPTIKKMGLVVDEDWFSR